MIAGVFLLTFALYSTLDIYVAFAPTLTSHFKTGEPLLKLTFLIGPAISMLLSHPVASLLRRFSYRGSYTASVLFFTAGCWLSGLPHFWCFVLGRTIQALSLTGVSILNASLLATALEDQQEKLQSIFQYYSGTFSFVFLVSPLLGALIYQNLGFQWCFYLPTLLSILALGMLLFSIPETFQKGTSQKRHTAKLTLLNKNLFIATFPSALSFLFSIQMPFLLSRFELFSDSKSIAIVQTLPLLSQLVASFAMRSGNHHMGSGPLLATVLAFGGAVVSPVAIRPFLLVSALCFFPFFSVPLMAKATTLYLRGQDKIAASSHLNFTRNFFIVATLLASTALL